MGLGLLAMGGKWLAESALMTSPAGGFIRAAGGLLGKVPKQVWLVLLGALLLWLGYRWHTHEIHKLEKSYYQQGYDAAKAEIKAEEARKTAEVVAITNEGDGQQEQLNKGVQKSYAQDVSSINATADELRRSYSQRRPVGVARSDVPHIPGSAANAAGDVGGGRPEDDRLGQSDPRQAGAADPGPVGEPTITVPALQLIDRAVVCDTDHTQVKTWWAWYNGNKKIYEDWVAKVKKAAQPEQMELKPSP